jgi:hypothetical protein
LTLKTALLVNGTSSRLTGARLVAFARPVAPDGLMIILDPLFFNVAFKFYLKAKY